MMKTTEINLMARLSSLALLVSLAIAGSAVGLKPAGAAAASTGAFDGLEHPVVVELFTSQGCSSCPPADRLAGELAAVPGVLALSFHVDYWDYIGWKDPFASPAYSQRQRDYGQALSLRYVYTPQMVIDGRYDVVGFRRNEVLAAIEQAAADRADIVMTLDPASGRLTVPAAPAPAAGATLWLALYDSQEVTEVARGENAGRELVNYNVVREFRPLGKWSGEALDITLDLSAADGHDACAVLLQADTPRAGATGPILSAVTMALPAQ